MQEKLVVSKLKNQVNFHTDWSCFHLTPTVEAIGTSVGTALPHHWLLFKYIIKGDNGLFFYLLYMKRLFKYSLFNDIFNECYFRVSKSKIYRFKKLSSVFLFNCFFVEIFISQVQMLCQTSRKQKILSRKSGKILVSPTVSTFMDFLKFSDDFFHYHFFKANITITHPRKFLFLSYTFAIDFRKKCQNYLYAPSCARSAARHPGSWCPGDSCHWKIRLLQSLAICEKWDKGEK